MIGLQKKYPKICQLTIPVGKKKIGSIEVYFKEIAPDTFLFILKKKNNFALLKNLISEE